MRPIDNLVKTGFLWLVLLLAGAASMAQQKTIEMVKGMVKTEDGAALVGASVSVPGTAISTNSKRDGSFELHNVPEEALIRVSFVGLNNAEIKLKPGTTTLNVTLTIPNSLMDQVTVNVGLYKRPNGNFTGAAKTLTGDELKAVNPTNVLKALAALDPSIRIAENNVLGSDPNKLPTIQVRGQNNLPTSLQDKNAPTATAVTNGDIMSSYLSNPNEPLIILDGFQTTLQAIYDMDINRIASITILKDAAATTAYGSKAANGVVVVETKVPVAGKTQVTYSINVNVDMPDLSSYHLLDAAGILEAQRLAGVYNDPTNFKDVALKQWYDYRLQQVRSGVNTDWLSKPVRTGVGTNHSLAISGGSRFIRYGLSINYNNSVGVMKGSARDRFSLNNQVSYARDRIRFSNNTSISYSKGNNSPWGSYSQYASQFPFFKPVDSAGNVLKILEPAYTDLGIAMASPGSSSGFTNAAYNAQLYIKDYSYYYGLTNNTNVEWSITDGLRMKAALSISMNLPGSEQFYPADHTIFVSAPSSTFQDLGSYSQTRGRNTVTDGRWGIDYNKKLGKHSFLASVGLQAQATNSNSTSIDVTGIPNDYLAELGLAYGYGNNTKPSAQKSITHSISSYASVSYNYLSRYTVELTANTSGSSQFGANNRLAPFWATGVSWNIDREPFFPKNPVIQQLKVRATTGITGNQNFAAYLGQPTYLYSLQNNYRLQLGANLMSYANPDLKWQQTLKNNLGVTASFFNGRLNAGFEMYEEITNNLILPLDVAPSTGWVNYQNNLGATKNSGYELTVNAPIIRNKQQNIFWSVFANAGHYKNVITRLSPAIDALNKGNNINTDLTTQTKPLPRYEVGQSLTRIWAVKSLGIDPATGREVFEKLDGSQTFDWDPNDKRPVGDASPKIKGMFGSNLTYKGFILNVNLSFQYGAQMYNQTLVDKVENVELSKANADERVLTERWKQPGDKASFKALVANGANGLQVTRSTSRFVQNDNFLEASSLSVGYSFPSDLLWVKKLHLSTPRLVITQTQAFRWATIKTERGTGYPFARSYSFGLSTSF